MKKIICLILLCCMVMAVAPPTALADFEFTLYNWDSQINLSTPIIERNGQLYIAVDDLWQIRFLCVSSFRPTIICIPHSLPLTPIILRLCTPLETP